MIMLAGCLDGPEIIQLREENTQLKNKANELESRNQKLIANNKEAEAKISIDYGNRIANLQQMQMEAAISGGCRFLFNVCPTSITSPGDSVLKNNLVSGGSHWIFWTIYMTKILTIFLSFLLILELWSKRFKPNLNALKKIQEDLKYSEHKLSEIQQIKSTVQEKIKNLTSDLENIRQKIKNAETDLQSKIKQMQALEEEYKKKESAIKALQSFKF